MASWQQMRLQTVMVLNGMGAKKKDGSPLSLQDIIELPGDNQSEHLNNQEEEEKTQQLLDQLYEANKRNMKKSTT